VPHIDHIICPVDLTETSSRALSYAFAWANWYGARVHVVHVAPLTVVSAPLAGVAVTLEQRPMAEIRHDVERYVGTVPNPGVGVDIHVFEGDPPSFIRKQAERYQRAVIVMGSHGRKGFERFVLGSVAERVVGSAVAPTLIVPPHDAQTPWADPVCKRILCAVDLLPSSLEGLRYALSLAVEADATLEVVHVIEDAAVDEVQTTQHFRVAEYLRYRAEQSLEEVREHIPDAARQACTIQERVVFGTPATAILREARAIGAEMIVMGAGDHAHLRSLWLGQATSHITRESLCPILVVPAPAVLRRTRVLEGKPIAREDWREEFDRVSREYLGEPATVTALDLAYAAPEVTALPLVGITMDQAAGGAIVMMLGGPVGAHISHWIADPTEVALDQSSTHAVARLLVRAADGSSTLLEVAHRAPTTLEIMADARIQF
jgi:nucleotide-binding universal stress UspA family protein